MPSEGAPQYPKSFDDLVQYCAQYEETIFVRRQTPDGIKPTPLSALPLRERADEIKRWWRERRFPHRVLR